MNDDYKVNLEVFEGPLDLLLHLIRKNDLTITDIPIALITEEYLKYLDAMQELNVNVAGEFLLMAAELMQIKSRMLLPVEEQAIEAEEDDPRADLQRRLLEYQRFKDASHRLLERSLLYRDAFVQQAPEGLPSRREVMVDENAFKLLEAFQIMLAKMPTERMQEVTIDRISVNERIFQMLDHLKNDEAQTLEALLPKEYDKYELVITFLALLEMSKLSMIKVYQAGKTQPIYITRRMQEVTQDEALKLVNEEGALSF